MKEDRWESLVDRWLRADVEFARKSATNSSNHGTEGTHSQGNQSDGCFKDHVVYIWNIHLSFPILFLFMHNLIFALQEKERGHPSPKLGLGFLAIRQSSLRWSMAQP